MLINLLIVTIAVNSVLSQLLLKRAIADIGSPGALAALPEFIAGAAGSPWVYASLVLQVLGYILWMIVISHEKLGVANAGLGACFYMLMAFSAWVVYGETLSSVQWAGIGFITIGVICVSLGQV
jgi:drug/metabolite transporter (DMT)-like permease